MSITKKVQFTVNKTKDIIIDLHYTTDYRKGVFWSYPDTKTNVGPFTDERIAIEDAKLYSTYGTTSKELLKLGSTSVRTYPRPSIYEGGYNSGRNL